jgi:hypothetical protein
MIGKSKSGKWTCEEHRLWRAPAGEAGEAEALRHLQDRHPDFYRMLSGIEVVADTPRNRKREERNIARNARAAANNARAQGRRA